MPVWDVDAVQAEEPFSNYHTIAVPVPMGKGKKRQAYNIIRDKQKPPAYYYTITILTLVSTDWKTCTRPHADGTCYIIHVLYYILLFFRLEPRSNLGPHVHLLRHNRGKLSHFHQ